MTPAGGNYHVPMYFPPPPPPPLTCTLHQHLPKLPDAPHSSQLQAHVGHILEGGEEDEGGWVRREVEEEEQGGREKVGEEGERRGGKLSRT